MKNKIIKIMAAASILMNLLAPVALAQFVPVVDQLNILSNHSHWTLEAALKAALTTFKKQLLDSMVDQIIQSINGGGRPRFVTDWGRFVKKAANDAAGTFVTELGAGFLCKPFSLKLQVALLPVKKFSQNADCTLDDIVRNIDDFYGDFRAGGWIGYSRAWEPENNFLGAYLMAADERITRMSDAANAAVNEGISGGGFLSTKTCKKDAQGHDIPSTCVVSTPGKTIGDIVSKGVGSSFDFIVSADDLGSYVGAITNALINKLIISGINSIQGAGDDGGFAASGLTAAQTTGNCPSLTGATLEKCQSYFRTYGNNFSFSQSGFIQQINLTLTPRQAAQTSLQQSITAEDNFIKSALDIYNQLSKITNLVCRSSIGGDFLRTDLMANIQSGITAERDIVTGLRQESSANQLLIDNLTSAEDQISKAPANDWSTLLPIFQSVEKKLDGSAAEDYRNAKATETTQISAKLSPLLSEYNRKLIACQNS